MLGGNLNIERAKEIIDEEVKKRSKKRGTSIEVERSLIYSQIRNNLSNHPEKYFIMDPCLTIDKLSELEERDVDIMFYTEAVVNNLINSNDYSSARELVRRYRKTDNGKVCKRLTNKINNAEIGYMTLQIMENKLSSETENKYFAWLKAKIKKTNANPQNIVLGRNCDDFKEIKLDDILDNSLRKQLNIELEHEK